MNDGVILYGAPGTGKDATTTALTDLSPHNYEHFKRIKLGTGRKYEYRTLTQEQLEDMRTQPDAIIWENQQYGGTYVVDRAELNRLELSGVTPVLHLGQPEAVSTLLKAKSGTHWLVIELTCPRAIAIDRIYARGTGDAAQRITVLDATPPLVAPDLRIDTSAITPQAVAAQIEHARQSRRAAQQSG